MMIARGCSYVGMTAGSLTKDTAVKQMALAFRLGFSPLAERHRQRVPCPRRNWHIGSLAKLDAAEQLFPIALFELFSIRRGYQCVARLFRCTFGGSLAGFSAAGDLLRAGFFKAIYRRAFGARHA